MCLKKGNQFHFYDSFRKCISILIFFTVIFRKKLRNKLELKPPPPLKSVATLPCKKCAAVQLHIHISENNLLIMLPPLMGGGIKR